MKRTTFKNILIYKQNTEFGRTILSTYNYFRTWKKIIKQHKPAFIRYMLNVKATQYDFFSIKHIEELTHNLESTTFGYGFDAPDIASKTNASTTNTCDNSQSFTWYRTATLESKGRAGTRQTKKNPLLFLIQYIPLLSSLAVWCHGIDQLRRSP